MVTATGREELEAQLAQMAAVAEYKAAEAERRPEIARQDAERARQDEGGIEVDRYVLGLATADEWKVIEAEHAHRLKALPADDAGLVL